MVVTNLCNKDYLVEGELAKSVPSITTFVPPVQAPLHGTTSKMEVRELDDAATQNKNVFH